MEDELDTIRLGPPRSAEETETGRHFGRWRRVSLAVRNIEQGFRQGRPLIQSIGLPTELEYFIQLA